MMRVLALFALIVPNAAMVNEGGNPMRKVVGMMRDMQGELEREAETEHETFEKAMCACQTGQADLTKVIDHSGSEISRLTAKIDEDTASKANLDTELKTHAGDKAAAEDSLGKATALRENEA